MKIYGLSGLGADKRVFNYLKLDCELIPIDWISNKKNESLKEYSERISKIIDKESVFGILGVSFGGLVAVEISKILKPNLTILISTVETKDELSPLIRSIGKTKLLKMLPSVAFNPPRKIAFFLFGTKNKELLNNILNDTDLIFAKWAVNELVIWNNQEVLNDVLRIHGTNDKLIPIKNNKKVKFIQGGEHFMIVDRAEEISKIINEEIKKTTHNSMYNQ